MSTQTLQSPVFLSYAQALLDLAGDNADAVGQELGEINQIVADNKTFSAYLADPSIAKPDRAGLLSRIFQGKVSQLLWNFIGVLNLKNRLKDLPGIAAAYKTVLDKKQGNVDVELTTAHALSDDQVMAAKEKISAALKKNAMVKTVVDDAIIGGVIVRVGDKLLDASVRYQLQAMKEQLMAKMPK